MRTDFYADPRSFGSLVRLDHARYNCGSAPLQVPSRHRALFLKRQVCYSLPAVAHGWHVESRLQIFLAGTTSRNEMGEKEWYSTLDFAKLIGWSLSKVQSYCKARPQLIKAKKHKYSGKGFSWKIHKDEVEKWGLLDKKK